MTLAPTEQLPATSTAFTLMKAIICTRYGTPEVLELQEVAKPIPRDNEVLVRIHATTVMMGDCQFRSLKLPFPWSFLFRLGFGFSGPRNKILGQEFAGEVESVGKDVTKFKPGDRVYGNTGLRFGAYAEYDSLPEDGFLTTKPANMSYDEAASIPSACLFVVPLLRKGNITPGKKVLIIGAGGTMGTLAVQLAKEYGGIVTAVDSLKKLPMLLSIGADRAIDYAAEDYTKGTETFDVIFDAVGKSSFGGCMMILRPGGVYLLGNPGLVSRIRGAWARRNSKAVVPGSSSYNVDDLVLVRGLIESGRVKPVIDRRYPLEHIADAHRYVDTGEKAGNVVITIP